MIHLINRGMITMKKPTLSEGMTNRVIIIGGSIGGMYAAKVLSEHYKDVILIDRDEFPENPVNRAGTPHAFHPHRFTATGADITRKFFPDYHKELLKLGAHSSLNKTVLNMNQYGSSEVKYERDDLKFSRAILEWVIREEAKKINNISFITNSQVTGLIATEDRASIIGVTVRNRFDNEKEKTYLADLVLDISGRSSKLSEWLSALGYQVPQPDILEAQLGYSTRRYRTPSHLQHLIDEWDVVNIAGQPNAGTFTGVFSFIENGIAEMILYRLGGKFPPIDSEEFEDAVSKLPVAHELIKQLEPSTKPRGFRIPQLYRHHYDKMRDWPAGLLVLGDAYCIYDPIFGQGMTVAALEADALADSLKLQQVEPKLSFERDIMKKFQQIIEKAWWLNCSNDLKWDGVTYKASVPIKGLDFGSKYLDLFLEYVTISNDWELVGLYWGVATLSISPNKILNASIVEKVLQSSNEGKQILEHLLLKYKKPLEEIIEDILPTFA